MINLKRDQHSRLKAGATISGLAVLLLCWFFRAAAVLPPEKPLLPEIDIRSSASVSSLNVSAEQRQAADALKKRLKHVAVEFDPITGSPKSISAGSELLTGENGGEPGTVAPKASRLPPNDPDRAVKAFILAHTNLFGFGPAALDKAQLSKSYRTEHNGVRTIVWEQQADGIPVFEGVLIAHITRRGELINLSSQFMRDPDGAVARDSKSSRPAVPSVHAQDAAVAALRSVGETTTADQIRDMNSETDRPSEVKAGSARTAVSGQRHHRFRGPGIKGDCEAKLTWLPMAKDRLRLCWDLIFMSHKRGEMFRVLVDAHSGQILLRRNLTCYISDATYRIFTSDSPTPKSPGWSHPCTNQPPYVSSELITLSAFDTNASPNGWIDDGGTETLGNNVDAHTDHSGNDMPDLPRPDGGTNRLFDFTMDLTTDDPTNYSNASVVNAFYWVNWMHDRLYQLGFTEAAGNFQGTNFGRGGSEGDAVIADVQDGSGFNNSSFSVGPDGTPGRVQYFIFTGPSPRRDAGLDAEVILHECTHGMSNRRVGDGVLISALQSRGMGEGWSDFYALCLLSDPADDENGNYAFGAYVSYNLLGNSVANYYYGVRRYPYTTDMARNPLTYKDIDPTQADPHTGVTKNPVIGSDPAEVHNQGELWCSALWQARANLIAKEGALAGNALILQFVTDGMNLCPPNPNFLQARDAIIQADVVDTGGAYQRDLWLAFAKRGLGFSASSPDSSTTTGVVEAFDYPDDLLIVPLDGFISEGPVGGPFNSNSVALLLSNLGNSSLDWGLSITSSWLNASVAGDTIAGRTNETVTIGIDDSATNLAAGIYTSCVVFTNTSSTNLQARHFTLKVGQPDPFTEFFANNDDDLAFRRFTFTPDGSTNGYSVCQESSHLFPTDPSGGNVVFLADDDYVQVTLSGTNTVAIYGTRTNVFFIGSNGYLTMNDGDVSYLESLETHFSLPRISMLFHDLDPEAGGTISWKELPDRVAVTYQNVPQYNSPFGNSFQTELFFDGRLRISYLDLNCLKNISGLSAGMGVPPVFVESDLSSYAMCPASPPSFQTEPSGSFTLMAGTNLTLFGSATGGEPLLYQWQRDETNLIDGGSISGATNEILNLTTVLEADSGSYRLIVTNDYGSVTSSITMLTVTSVVNHFVWAHIPSPQAVAVPFLVSIEARDASDILASNFNGTVSLGLTNTGVSVAPTASGTFSNGLWSGSLTIDSAGSDLELVADDGLAHTGRTQLGVVPAPALSLQAFTNGYYLVWTAGAPLLKIETTTNLADSVWVEAPGASQSGDQLFLPFFTDDPSRFYRLRYGN